MFARTTSIVVILAMMVTLLSFTSAIPIPGEIQKRGLGDLVGSHGHLLQGVQKGASISNAANYITDIQALLGTGPGVLKGPESPASHQRPNARLPASQEEESTGLKSKS
ncbi:hypothetical protein BGZ76_000942 [Entomortierella beljakovae]|nr:hypothetical protein BGZ76_000942 [Entomortierella beljakovae]